ncbi:hypothetical protein SAMN05421755_10513 [Nitrosomonas sp. Nm33]|nr:hypothetical protein SAMN05421755_10513 [Nitrosomonas sp. Nm33]
MVKNFSDCTGFQDDSDDFQGSTANRGPGNVAAQTFQFAALVHGATYLGMQTEAVGVGTVCLNRLRKCVLCRRSS